MVKFLLGVKSCNLISSKHKSVFHVDLTCRRPRCPDSSPSSSLLVLVGLIQSEFDFLLYTALFH